MASTGEAGTFRFVAGLTLLLVAGLGPLAFDSVLHRDRSGVPGYNHATAEPLTGWDDPRLVRRDGEPTLPYVRRVTRGVYGAVYHCEPTAPQAWATATLAVASRGGFPGGEGVIHPAALRCGFCSQVSSVLSRALRDNGVPSARPRGLDGHVVVTFRHQGQDFVADPDYGVGPWAVDWSEPVETEATARSLYGSLGATQAPAAPIQADRLVAIFADTRTDILYDVARLDHLESGQGATLTGLHVGRWVLIAVGLLLTSHSAASRTGRSPNPGQARLPETSSSGMAPA